MLKKLVLASAIVAVTSSAYAMEALDEATLSATTGQAGLTVTMTPDVTIDHVRYTDTDGIAAAAAGWTPSVIAGYNNPGTVDIGGLQIKADKLQLDLDVGTADTNNDGVVGGAGDKTSLFISQKITNLSVSIGNLTLDGGAVLSATNANSASFGGIALTDITLPDSKLRLTPGGATGTQGITIANGGGKMNLSLDFKYTDDNNSITLGTAGNAADQGIDIKGIDMGTTQIDVVAGGLQITSGAMNIDSVQLGGTSGIQIGGASIGQVALLGVHLGANVITVAGH